MSTACTYCGHDVMAHDPVFLQEPVEDDVADVGPDDAAIDRHDVGRFCNYACLAAYVEDEDLATGACCRIDLD